MTACRTTRAIRLLIVPVIAVSAVADFGADDALIGVYAGMLFASSAVSRLAAAGVAARTAVMFLASRDGSRHVGH